MRISRLIAVLIAAAALPSLAGAGDVQVTSSTQYLRYSDYLSNPEDQEDVAQYLRVNATFGEKDAIRVQGYGRIIGQLTSSVEPRNDLADDIIGRLYYLYVEVPNLVPDHLGLRAGRTYVANGAVPGIVDGALVAARNLVVPGLGATAFGGRRVFLENKSEQGFDDDWLVGGSVFYDTVKYTRIEASYARDYREGELARDVAALDVSTTPLAMVSLVGRAKYDLVSERASELLGQVKLSPLPALVLDVELYQSTPTFDRFSFYRFFDVEDYRQASVGAEYRFGELATVFGRYAFEKFDSDEDANLFAGGLSLRPVAALFLNASYEHRDGFAGRLGGLRTSAGYTFTRPGDLLTKASLLAGVDYDDFKREDSRDGTAKRYWAGTDVEITKRVGVAARVQLSETILFDEAWQGWVALDLNL